jgi:hypothetical protein
MLLQQYVAYNVSLTINLWNPLSYRVCESDVRDGIQQHGLLQRLMLLIVWRAAKELSY